MKFSNRTHRGTLALVVTAAILVVVLLLNVGATALFGNGLLFGDLTNESMYRLNRGTVNLMKQTIAQVQENRQEGEDAPEEVEILFCTDADLLLQNDTMRYIYYTARNLAKKFPSFVKVRTVDVWSNPSAVDAYRVNSYSTIYQTDVIVSSGSEFRVLSRNSFYIANESGSEDFWAYNGEKQFVKTIRAVTNVDAPVACLSVNHGETIAANEEYQALLAVVKGAGFRIRELDLAGEEIPEDCRMLLIFDPQSDFTSGNYLSGKPSELGKLDAFLREANSLFLFVGPQTPVLSNLESFLEDWGIRFARYQSEDGETTSSYRVVSPMDSVDGDQSLAVIGEYVTAGAGASFTKAMRTQGASPKVIFPNAMPLCLSPTYQKQISLATETTNRYEYAYYYKNNEWREVYNIFTSSNADRMTYAEAIGQDGKVLTDAAGNPVVDPGGNFPLATLTLRYNYVKEGTDGGSVDRSSKVCVFGSTAFAENALLQSSAYGNNDLLLEIMRAMGNETFPVSTEYKRLHQNEMGGDYYTDAGNRGRAVALVLIPAIVATGLGVWIVVRRRRAR